MWVMMIFIPILAIQNNLLILKKFDYLKTSQNEIEYKMRKQISVR